MKGVAVASIIFALAVTWGIAMANQTKPPEPLLMPAPVTVIALAEDMDQNNTPNSTDCISQNGINSISCTNRTDNSTNSTNCSNSTDIDADVGIDPVDTAALDGAQTGQRTLPNWDEAPDLTDSQVHLVGMDTKTSFNGTWVTDSRWRQLFYKDIKNHQMLTGTFEAQKSVRFHEAPFPEGNRRFI